MGGIVHLENREIITFAVNNFFTFASISPSIFSPQKPNAYQILANVMEITQSRLSSELLSRLLIDTLQAEMMVSTSLLSLGPPPSYFFFKFCLLVVPIKTYQWDPFIGSQNSLLD